MTAGARFPRPPSSPRPPAPRHWSRSTALAEGIADLRRRCDAAGRDWSGIDITFTNIGGGSPGDDDFNADAYLSALEKLAAVGVTWVQVQCRATAWQHAVEAIGRFGSSVIAAA